MIIVDKNKRKIKLFIYIILPIILLLFSLTVGRYSMTLEELMETVVYSIVNPSLIQDPNTPIVLFQIRIPRVIVVMLVGAGLGLSGAAFQGLFRNPLVSSDVLGANAGASFGAALALLLFLPTIGVQVLAFVFGLLAVFVATRFNKVIKYNPTLSLVLGGILIKSFFDSGISIIKYVADPWDTLPAITFWLMGSFVSVKPKNIIEVGIPLIIASIVLFLNRQNLNVASFGEDEAKSMGVNTNRLRKEVILSCTLLAAASVSVSGQISWVGLVVPHIARWIVGPNFKELLPMSATIGSCYLLICDNICRNLFPTEIPIGIITALIGIPFFVVIMKKGGGRINE